MYARVARSKEAVNLFIKFLYNMYRWVSGLESQDVLIKYNHTYGQDYGSDPTFSVARSNSRRLRIHLRKSKYFWRLKYSFHFPSKICVSISDFQTLKTIKT